MFSGVSLWRKAGKSLVGLDSPNTALLAALSALLLGLKLQCLGTQWICMSQTSLVLAWRS